MKQIIFTAILIFSFCLLVFSQTEPKFVYRKGKLVAVEEIDFRQDCGLNVFYGITKKIEVEQRGDDNVAVVFLRTKKQEEYIYVKLDEFSNADRANLFYYLLKRGKTLRIQVFTCGSGGFYYAKTIK